MFNNLFVTFSGVWVLRISSNRMSCGAIRQSSNQSSGHWLQCSSKGALVLSSLRSWERMAGLRVARFASKSLEIGRRSDGCSSAGMCFITSVWTDGSIATGGRALCAGLLWLWERWRRASSNQLLLNGDYNFGLCSSLCMCVCVCVDVDWYGWEQMLVILFHLVLKITSKLSPFLALGEMPKLRS